MGYDTRFELIRSIAWVRRTLGIRFGQGFINRVLYPPKLRVQRPHSVMIRYDKTFSLPLNTRSWIEWCLFLDGYFEYPLVRLMQKLVQPGDTVFDAGANIGVHTLLLSRLVGATGHVFSIEPCTPILKKLRRNVALNKIENITILPYALSDESGNVTLFWREEDTNEGQATFWANGATNTTEMVRTVTLDQLVSEYNLSAVHLLKLDIQGAEFKALQGGYNTLLKHKPILIFEADWNWEFSKVSFSEVQYFLEQLGYSLYSIDKRGTPVPLSQNPTGEILAIASNHISLLM